MHWFNSFWFLFSSQTTNFDNCYNYYNCCRTSISTGTGTGIGTSNTNVDMNVLTNGGVPSVSVYYYVHQYDAWHPKRGCYNKIDMYMCCDKEERKCVSAFLSEEVANPDCAAKQCSIRNPVGILNEQH